MGMKCLNVKHGYEVIFSQEDNNKDKKNKELKLVRPVSHVSNPPTVTIPSR